MTKAIGRTSRTTYQTDAGRTRRAVAQRSRPVLVARAGRVASAGVVALMLAPARAGSAAHARDEFLPDLDPQRVGRHVVGAFERGDLLIRNEDGRVVQQLG